MSFRVNNHHSFSHLIGLNHTHSVIPYKSRASRISTTDGITENTTNEQRMWRKNTIFCGVYDRRPTTPPINCSPLLRFQEKRALALGLNSLRYYTNKHISPIICVPVRIDKCILVEYFSRNNAQTTHLYTHTLNSTGERKSIFTHLSGTQVRLCRIHSIFIHSHHRLWSSGDHRCDMQSAMLLRVQQIQHY